MILFTTKQIMFYQVLDIYIAALIKKIKNIDVIDKLLAFYSNEPKVIF